VKIGYSSRFKLKLIFKPPFDWCSITLNELGPEGGELIFKFSPRLAGEYTSDWLVAECLDSYSLINAYEKYPFKIEVKVYPKALIAIAKAVEFLIKAGVKGIGDQPIEARGRGSEYAETREYVPGDSLRHIDHKATARLGKIMVKEFYTDAGFMAHLIYDVRVVGPISGDQLASTFLNTALGLAKAGVPFGLTIHNEERALVHLKPVNALAALEIALGYVISLIEVEPEDLDILLEPRVSSHAKALLIKLKGLRPFLESSIEKLKAPYLAVERLIEEISSPISILAVSGLTGKLTPLIELSRASARRMGELKLLSPCKPWLDAGSLEEAYRLYVRWIKAKKILKSAGVKVEALPPEA
jgi:uncharacterized protein (DUF58 family)